MRITDKEAIKELKRVRSGELEEMVETYPEEEIEGKSDMQIIMDELSYILSNFKEDGHVLYYDLREAREILRETKNGKVIPLWRESLEPIYSKDRIQRARNTVNEYNRLLALHKRLKEKGLIGRWEGWM